MLNSGKKNSRIARQKKINILTRVVRKKKFGTKQKNHSPPPPPPPAS